MMLELFQQHVQSTFSFGITRHESSCPCEGDCGFIQPFLLLKDYSKLQVCWSMGGIGFDGLTEQSFRLLQIKLGRVDQSGSLIGERVGVHPIAAPWFQAVQPHGW